MRISTLQMYQQGIEAFGKQQTKLSHLQQQISSGVRITKPSDDPAASARVLQLGEVAPVAHRSLLPQQPLHLPLHGRPESPVWPLALPGS